MGGARAAVEEQDLQLRVIADPFRPDLERTRRVSTAPYGPRRERVVSP